MNDLVGPLVWYVVYTLPLFLIAVKSEHSLAWLAFVPIANLWLMCDMTDLDLWWILIAMLVPLIGGIVFQAVVWMRLAENTNKPSWLGLLMVIPLVDIAVGYYIAMVNT